MNGRRTTSKTSNAKDSHDKSVIKISPKNDLDYKVEESMATFTMLQVLKEQRHYQQALAVIKLLQSKNMDADRIAKERSEILALISRDAKT